MGRGRAPCCDKSQVKRGPWSPTEDLRLISFIQKFGHDNWRSLPNQAGLQRCGKSCRLRWINYLRPDVKRGNFTREEEDTIISLHQSIGNKWSRIAAHLPGRTDNEIKNVWNTYLKKRLASPPNEESSSPSPSPSSSSCSFPFVNSTTAQANASSVVGQAMVEQLFPPPDRQAQEESLKHDQLTSSGSSNLYQECDCSHHLDPPTKDILCPSSENALEEIDKPNRALDDNGIERGIPLEFDHDFWELFGNLDGGGDIRPTNSKAWGVNILGEEIQFKEEMGDQDRDWLRGLERELGLEDPSAL